MLDILLLTGRVSYVDIKQDEPVSKDKQKTAEMQRELREWHARARCNHELHGCPKNI